MSEYADAERMFRGATPPRAGSTSWYDACDLLATEIKRGLRERFGRGFPVEVYGDEVGLIVRIRGDGYGASPWSVDRSFDPHGALAPQVAGLIEVVDREIASVYVRD
ncbi:MAG: hypothetical protein AAF726_12230 [Planctomycetota bacterium]